MARGLLDPAKSPSLIVRPRWFVQKGLGSTIDPFINSLLIHSNILFYIHIIYTLLWVTPEDLNKITWIVSENQYVKFENEAQFSMSKLNLQQWFDYI
jgi:hypothetical protein